MGPELAHIDQGEEGSPGPIAPRVRAAFSRSKPGLTIGREQRGEKDDLRVCGQIDAVVDGSVRVGCRVMPEFIEALCPALLEM